MTVTVNITDNLIEKIPTGLTRNYVQYWNEKQALKEAMQNIAYGVMKSGKKAVSSYKNGIGKIEDFHTGFGKNMLYIGESEQREDEDGLGNFGEGWKVFLLVMARNEKLHRVETVGFTFWGSMEETPHGTEILVINIEDNDRTVGTKVVVECEEKDFNEAMQSFAVLGGIQAEEIKEESILKGRMNELWINGVRIEQNDNTNPLELHYAYNLKDRTLMNRDRSQVETFRAYSHIKGLIGKQDKEFIIDYLKEAMNGNECQDIQRGPSVYCKTDREKWIEAIEEVYDKPISKLVIPSYDVRINREAEYRGYTVINLPQQWYWELETEFGIKKADTVITLKPELKSKELDHTQKKLLQSAKLKVKKALKLNSVKDLPRIEVVENIEINGVTHAEGMYDEETKIVYVAENAFKTDRTLFRVLLHECVHWKTGYGDNTEGFTRAFEEIICDLMGL